MAAVFAARFEWWCGLEVATCVHSTLVGRPSLQAAWLALPFHCLVLSQGSAAQMMLVGRARERRNIVYRKLKHGMVAAKVWRNHLVSRMSSVLRTGVRTLCVYWSFGRLLRWRGGAACVVSWAEMFWPGGAYGNAY